jgi:Ca-activated chloride channel family protein
MTSPSDYSDDPRLTAYVLGELDTAEAAELAREIETNPDMQAAVDELRELIGDVTTALETEATPQLAAEQRASLETASVALAGPDGSAPPRRQFAVIVSTAVSVAVVAGVAMLMSSSETHQADSDVKYREDSSAVSYSMTNRSSSDVSSQGGESRYGKIGVVEGSSSGLGGGGLGGGGIGAGGLGGGIGRDAQGLGDGGDPRAYKTQSERERIRRQLKNLGTLIHRQKTIRTTTESLPYSNSSPLGRDGRRRYDTPGVGKPGEGKPGEGRPGEGKPGQDQFESFFDSPLRRTPPARDSYPKGGSIVGLQNPGDFTPDPDVGFEMNFSRTGQESHQAIIENAFITPFAQPLSTFSIDVDTASYSNMRRFLTHGQLPPPNSVRIEELVNYFTYAYLDPAGSHPFSTVLEVGPCPWTPKHRLVRIGLKGREIDHDSRPPTSVVFLLDVSGSMRDANKLPLVKKAMQLLVGQMTEDDRIAIVTYAGNAGLVLDSTSGDRKGDILSAIHNLNASGSTNGEAGIQLAYTQAVKHFIEDGANRVILCTDGDFNVGNFENNELVTLITEKAKSDVFLSIYGFGMGNLKDDKLELLADKGNGQYAYIDNEREAKKVFVDELTGALYTIAKDVKIQVEFNPAHVGAYRLLGYENRILAAKDFNDDTKDAGEIGAGHTVTALYEIVPPEVWQKWEGVDKLKCQRQGKPRKKNGGKEMLTLKLRYKLPKADTSTKIEFPLLDNAKQRAAMPSRDFEWASSVVAFGMLLRNSQHKGQADFDLVRELAIGSKGDDQGGLREEFVKLIETAKSLSSK